MGPPYHTVSGNNITIYLDIVDDSDGTLGNAIDNILSQLAMQWPAIATATGMNITFAFGPQTAAPMIAIPAGLNVLFSASPPSGVNIFEFKIGRGASAEQPTRSARISYVGYNKGKGYIYERPDLPLTSVPDVSHEVGHVLGLKDRYYNAVYWLWDWAIDRTCQQVRKGQFGVPPNDYRDGVADNIPVFHESPRLAVRASLPMSNVMVAGDSQYVPTNNLMSSGAAFLSSAQMAIITSQGVEQDYRSTNWVAVLAEWQRGANPPSNNNIPNGIISAAPDFPKNNLNDLFRWLYPAWEARPQDGGRGLLFLPPGHLTPHRYACLSSHGPGKDNGVVLATILAIAKGKTRVHAFDGTRFNTVSGVNVIHPGWMCYVRRLIHDLVASD